MEEVERLAAEPEKALRDLIGYRQVGRLVNVSSVLTQQLRHCFVILRGRHKQQPPFIGFFDVSSI
jgi:hypothetical protein